MNELTIGGIIKNAIGIGVKNAPSLVAAIFLWLVTIWIPYLNVGTTIGLIGLLIQMGKGSVASPTSIFNGEYRKQMGEFFLVSMFVMLGVYFGLAFIIIPGIVIAIAWSLAPLLVIDKGMNPMAAIQRSNDLTYGKKWRIFWGSFFLMLILYIPSAIVLGILARLSEVLAGLISIPVFVIIFAAQMGASAYIYATLTADMDQAPPAE